MKKTASPRRALPLPIAAALLAAASAFGAVTSADLQIAKTRTTPAPAHPGDVIGYDITVTNNGPDTATNVSVSDAVPANTTFDEGGALSAGWSCVEPPAGGTGTMTCSIASLASGEIADFYIELDVEPGAAPEVDNTASVSSDTPDPDLTNNASTVPTEVAAPPAPTVPTLSGAALAGLAAAVSLAAVLLLRR